MFKTRMRKVIRDIWARKGRTALVSMAIFIGVLGTIALFSLNFIITEQLESDLKEDELSMLDVFTQTNADSALDDAAYLDGLREIEGVTEVLAAASNFTQFKTDPDEDFIDATITGYSVSLDEGLPIEPMRLIDGRYPAPGADEVVLERRMAESYDLSVGDSIYFRILSPSRQPETGGQVGMLEEWTVVGLAFHPYAGQPETAIYTTAESNQYISSVPGFNMFRARFEDFETTEAQKDAFTRYLATETPYRVVFSQANDPQNNQLIQQVRTLGSTLSTLALISLLVSGFLVINVIGSIVNEQKRQIGIMKSLGATQVDNFAIYTGIAFFYGLIGVVPGVIFGIPLGNIASHALAPELNTYLEGFRFSPPAIVLGIIVGLAVPVLSALFPVFFGTRVGIREAITDLGITNRYGQNPLSRIIELLPVPLTMRQGISHIVMQPVRLGFTIVTLTLAVGVFMGIFALFTSLTGGINSFLDTFNVEIGVFPTEGYPAEEITAVIQEDFVDVEEPTIDDISLGFQLEVNFVGYEPVAQAGGPPAVFAYGYAYDDPTPAFNFEVTEGEVLTEETVDNGIIFSSALANKMEVDVGDSVTLDLPSGEADLQIVGIADFPVDQVWMDWRTLARLAGFQSGVPQPNRYITMLRLADSTLVDDNVTTVGVDEQITQFLTMLDGEFISDPASEVAISQALAEAADLSVGDDIQLANASNGQTTETYQVVGIFEPPQIPGQNIPPNLIAMEWRTLAQLKGRSLEGGEPLPQGYFLTTTLDDPTEDAISRISNDLQEAFLARGIPVNTFNFISLKNEISQGFLTIQAIIQAVALLIAMVGALGLLTTLSMSVYERQKEIGVMRSIGASSLTVAFQFLTEGLIVGFIAWLIGLPVGYLIQLLLLNVTGFEGLFSAVIDPVAALVGLVGMMVITTLASLWPSLAAARKTVSEILRYQ